jgi:hypothetical protein
MITVSAFNHLLAIGKTLCLIEVTKCIILHLFESAPARNVMISIKRMMMKYQEFHQKKTAF